MVLSYQHFLLKLVSVAYKFLLSKPTFRFPSVAIFARRHGKDSKILINFVFIYKHAKVATSSYS